MTLIALQLPVGSQQKSTGAFDFPAGERVRKTKFALNGVGIPLRNGLTWGFRSGVTPQQASINLTIPYADKVVEVVNQNQGKVKLELIANSIDNKELPWEFEGLSLLPRYPNNNVFDVLTITDDRWRWPNKNVYQTFNLVRKADDEFALPVTFAGVLDLTQAAKYYVPWTIQQDAQGNATKPYTSLDIVVFVLKNYLGYDDSNIDLTDAATSKYVPPNIVLVGQKAHTVISRFLSESDNNMYIDDKGKVCIYKERIPYGEREFDQKLRPSLRGRVDGQMWIQDRSSIRPTNLYLSFEQEEEYLLTYKESSGATTSGAEAPAASTKEALSQLEAKRIYLRNVTTTVVDKQVGDLPAGAIVTIEQALEAFGKAYGSGPISLDDFRENYGVAAPAVFSLVMSKADATALLDPKAVVIWSKIVGDYRKRFQIPHYVSQYIKDGNNVLVAVIDPETGKRKPSEVFSIFSWVILVNARINKKRTDGVALDSFTNLQADGKYKPVPATISDIDPETGLFELVGLEDMKQPGAVTDIILGRPVSGDKFFEDSFAEGETALGRDSLIGNHGLEPDWEMSVVASIVLLPKDPKSMYWIDQTPPSGITAGKGPPVEVHLTYDTVRKALKGNDAYRSNPPGFINEALIKAIAKQEGDRRWVTFSDQLVGSASFALSEEAKKLRPQGPVSQVTFSVSSGGAVRMNIQAAPISEGRDIRNTLESEMLEAIFRQVHFDVTTGTR